MRGITTPVTKIRRQVFTEIARLAYEDGDYSRIEELDIKSKVHRMEHRH